MAEILAFTADQVCRLTGLSARQLRYWDATGFFSPTYINGYRRRAFGRIYSFRDLVGLRTIALLRNKYRIPLQALRKVGEWLRREHETPWSSLTFAIYGGKRVVFFDPHSKQYVTADKSQQTMLSFALEAIANDMRAAASRLSERAPDQVGQIVRNRYVVHNAPALAGTRIPTSAIWNFHKAGYEPAAIVLEYPRLTERDVEAAVAFEAGRRKVA